MIRDSLYLCAFALLIAAALFTVCARGEPPQAPPLQEPKQAPPVVTAGNGRPAPAPGRYQWYTNTATPGQLNLRLNGRQIGAYRFADRVYLELLDNRWTTQASTPPVRLPSEEKIRAAAEVPAKIPFADITPGTTAQTGAVSLSTRTQLVVGFTTIVAPNAIRFGGTVIQCLT